MTKSKSFARDYISKKEDKELMSLEKLLQRRRNTLENWVVENNVHNVVQAEERAKTLGVMITFECLTKLEAMFAQDEAEISTPSVVDEQSVPKKKKKTSGSFTDLFNESTAVLEEEKLNN
jgi:hypothetical protein